MSRVEHWGRVGAGGDRGGAVETWARARAVVGWLAGPWGGVGEVSLVRRSRGKAALGRGHTSRSVFYILQAGRGLVVSRRSASGHQASSARRLGAARSGPREIACCQIRVSQRAARQAQR